MNEHFIYKHGTSINKLMNIHTKYHIKDEHQELQQSYNIGICNGLRILNTLHMRPKSIHASARNTNTELW